MAYVIIRDKYHNLSRTIPVSTEYRFYVTLGELRILKFANCANKEYNIQCFTNPKTVKKLIKTFGPESFVSTYADISPKDELLKTFCKQCIPKYLEKLKPTSYLLKIEIALLLN